MLLPILASLTFAASPGCADHIPKDGILGGYALPRRYMTLTVADGTATAHVTDQLSPREAVASTTS